MLFSNTTSTSQHLVERSGYAKSSTTIYSPLPLVFDMKHRAELVLVEQEMDCEAVTAAQIDSDAACRRNVVLIGPHMLQPTSVLGVPILTSPPPRENHLSLHRGIVD